MAAEDRLAILIGAAWRPIPAEPIDKMRWRLGGHAFPPDVAVIGEGHICKDGIAEDGVHRDGIARTGCAGRHAKESGLRVDGMEIAIRAGLDPSDIIAHTCDFPTCIFQIFRRNHHRKIRLSACAWEGGCDIGFGAIGRFHAENQHVFSHPTLIAGHGGGDAQGETFFSQEGIAAITRAIADDQPLLGEMRDVGIFGIAWPGNIGVALGQRPPHRVKALYEDACFFDLVINLRAEPGHDSHVGHDIGTIGDFDPVLGDRRSDWAHAEGNDIERPSPHATMHEAFQAHLHALGGLPVVGWARVFFGLGANECAFLHARNIAGVASHEERVRALGGIEPLSRSGGDQGASHGEVLFGRSVAPMNAIGTCVSGDLIHP